MKDTIHKLIFQGYFKAYRTFRNDLDKWVNYIARIDGVSDMQQFDTYNEAQKEAAKLNLKEQFHLRYILMR